MPEENIMRKQIGTVRVTRRRIYPLDPYALGPDPTSVVVEPGEYPVYEDGISRYWRLTGTLNRQSRFLGDGFFTANPGDAPSDDDDVVFYSRRYGPDEWADLVNGFAAYANPALAFTLTR
jgi:hypothetical protein